MAIYKPTELLDFLASLGVSPNKALSQNFLIDGNIIKKIIKTANVQTDDIVIEIGPGPGSLTEALLGTGAKVIAIEKDRTLASSLERFSSDNLTIFCEDVLKFDFEKNLPGNKKAKVIANLPYNITTPILTNLVPKHKLISSLVVMVQEEVGRRFTAKPNTAEYSSFTVFLNYFSQPKYAFTVSKNCFFPVPKVESAIVELELKSPPKVSNEEKFFLMTRTAFGQRRKMLRRSLKDLYSSHAIEAALVCIGKDPLCRPEQLSLENFIGLFECLSTTSLPHTGK